MFSRTLARMRPVLMVYAENIRAFSPNARCYLVNVVLLGSVFGVFRLLFNFYVLSLGYDPLLLGNLITVSSMTALLFALPMGYLADRLGRKRALILATFLSVLVFVGIVIFPSTWMLIAMSVLSGFSQSLSGVTMGPFLMENSMEKERTYLFSISSGLMTTSGFVGNWIGGYMPTWLGKIQHVAATSSQAYGASVLVLAVFTVLGIIPLFLIREERLPPSLRSPFAPLSYLKTHMGLLSKMILPVLTVSIGAGLTIPFLNIFYRQVHHQSDPVIGQLFAFSLLAMGLGMIIAPPLADRYGKIRLVVVTMGWSIPFLILLGFSPWYWLSGIAYLVRMALMNMTAPVYQSFVMEHVDQEGRATAASLISMANSFGWAVSPTVSGWLQVRYGFAPAFIGTIVLYILAAYFYWVFFWKKPDMSHQVSAV